jgi:uncharacterized cupredoxin-like copper-binding protein
VQIAAKRPRRRFVAVAVMSVAAMSFLAIGCGGDDDTSTTASVPTTTTTGATGATGAAGGGETLKISETDFKLDPSDPSVKAGSVTIDVSNDGETTHSLEVEGNGLADTSLPADLAPGDSGNLTVDLQPGTYTMYCPIDDHRAMGMEGTIEVK